MQIYVNTEHRLQTIDLRTIDLHRLYLNMLNVMSCNYFDNNLINAAIQFTIYLFASVLLAVSTNR